MTKRHYFMIFGMVVFFVSMSVNSCMDKNQWEKGEKRKTKALNCRRNINPENEGYIITYSFFVRGKEYTGLSGDRYNDFNYFCEYEVEYLKEAPHKSHLILLSNCDPKNTPKY